MHISIPADSGNAAVVDVGDDVAVVRIVPDHLASWNQWFHLRISGHGPSAELRIVDADQCSYPRGWTDYEAVASRDRRDWVRVPTTFVGGVVHIEVPAGPAPVWLASFAPFPLEQHRNLVAWCVAQPRARVVRFGGTLDGEDLDYVEVGNPAGIPVWILARQHAGETMAEWFAEGLLHRLLDEDDALAASLAARAVFRVVPNMNPDGSRRGHLRGNAAGKDLNRAWLEPDLATTPEVFGLRGAMDRLGVALCLDIHGDEALPWCFISGPSGTPSWDPARAALQERFEQTWARGNPDFQTEFGYRPNAPGQANLAICCHQVAERYGALAMTVEQPFKDNAARPDPVRGWSPARARRLGASVLAPIAAVLGDLPRSGG